MLIPLKKDGPPAFIPFLVAGQKGFAHTLALADILAEEGANVLELGVPFTDAMADGPVIQTASEAAAQLSGSLIPIFELAATLAKRHPQMKIVLFSYYNPILKLGVELFSQRAFDAGVSGVLCVDLPVESATSYRQSLDNKKLETIFLASPTTPSSRLKSIDQASSGFVYYVSRIGVTGVQQDLSPTVITELKDLRYHIQNPIAVGFGISTPAHASRLAPYADGIVVGSAFVKLIAESDGLGPVEDRTRLLARGIKEALSPLRHIP